MRKITAVILFLCFFLTLFGQYFSFYWQLRQLKTEMKKNISYLKSTKEVIQLLFARENVEELQWEGEHEFRYKGEMFDVVEKETDGDTLRILCIPDKKEDHLLAEYQKKVEKTQGQGKMSLLKLCSLHFIFSSICTPQAPQKLLTHSFLNFSAALLFQPHVIHTPPPKIG